MKYTMKISHKGQRLDVFGGKELVNSFSLQEVLVALVDKFNPSVAEIKVILLDGEDSVIEEGGND